MVSEVAFASILLVSAGLLARSFVRVLDVDLGFEPEQTAALRVDPSFRISSLAQQNAFLDDMLQRARSVTGVRAAGLIDILPFEGDRAWQVSGKGQIYPKDRHPEAFIRVVSDGYFKAAGIHLQAGRVFTEQDRARERTGSDREPDVGPDPLAGTRPAWTSHDTGRRPAGDRCRGRYPSRGAGKDGRIRDVSSAAADQRLFRHGIGCANDASSGSALASGLRTALRPMDPNLPVREFQSLQDLVDKAVSPRRFLVMLLGGFAVFALLLASLGIYAVISYSVNQRVQEIGIRMALGASPAELQRRILLGTFGLAALGLALGIAASRALSNTLGSLLFGVTSGDPATYVGVGALLIVVAAVAGYIPARRASRIDPMVALRSN